MKQVSLRLAPELAAAIDAARGDVPRERWIRGVLEATVRGSSAGRGAGSDVARPVSPRRGSVSPSLERFREG